jgi:hypothetical protein
MLLNSATDSAGAAAASDAVFISEMEFIWEFAVFFASLMNDTLMIPYTSFSCHFFIFGKYENVRSSSKYVQAAAANS